MKSTHLIHPWRGESPGAFRSHQCRLLLCTLASEQMLQRQAAALMLQTAQRGRAARRELARRRARRDGLWLGRRWRWWRFPNGISWVYHGYKYLSIPFLNGRWRRCFSLRDDRTGVLALEFQWIHICSMLGLCTRRAHVGSIVGSMLSHVGPMLRPCRAYGEACWAMLSHCWAIVEPKVGYFADFRHL